MRKKNTMKTKKTKNKPRRTIRRKHNRRSIKRKSMKGGTVLPYSDLSQAFNLIGHNLTKGVDTLMVPATIDNVNSLPFKQ